MTELIDAVEADRALKARHRAMWALGGYPAVATEIIADLGPRLVEACGVRRGDHVLDVAAGSGNAAIPAALAGASVVASDLRPNSWRSDGRRLKSGESSWNGAKPMPRRCRSATTSSTPCCPVSV